MFDLMSEGIVPSWIEHKGQTCILGSLPTNIGYALVLKISLSRKQNFSFEFTLT